MPRSAPLPKSLSYLTALRRQLAALPEEEVNEDMDPYLLQSVFLRRIKELSSEEAKAALQTDLDQLQQWLDQPEQQAERLHFVLGFLLIAAESPERLSEVASQPRKLQVEMQFPPEAKVKKLHGGWKARWRGFTVFVLPEEKACFEREIELFREPFQQYAQLISKSVLPVELDNVTGFKKVQVIREVGTKDVSYALQVPGGHATAAILKKGTEWDESVFDQYLSTIQVAQEK